MLTLLRSRFRLVAVPLVAGGALVALAGVSGVPTAIVNAAAASTTHKCPVADPHSTRHSKSTCVSATTLIAKANAVKVPTMKSPAAVRIKWAKPAQSTGTAGDRARWAQIQAALSSKAA